MICRRTDVGVPFLVERESRFVRRLITAGFLAMGPIYAAGTRSGDHECGDAAASAGITMEHRILVIAVRTCGRSALTSDSRASGKARRYLEHGQPCLSRG